ncbi:hypothetical protein IDSA_09065 [Pseudidiomarina salinarum]|uniref:DUF4124 domain-containing protein n=1 Tax=Pseudidiomarina salinarum TaxID=435908 RepID=A0A094IXV9_9GAMM|nr:DUF4124 domain-containing protein [Pseudidiomarina salinarum]KFZ30664.1 hypothetical protein IDSA_09065 [Pseudidiomarina salinarum]RUO69183.1 DUF4124 domain-containing protein [Pseudidiomarina salinarum]
MSKPATYSVLLWSALLLTGASVLLTAPADSQQVYKKRKADGTVVYTDKPTADAEAITVDPMVTEFDIPPQLLQSRPTETEDAETYEGVEVDVRILTPEPQAAIRANDGEIRVSWEADVRNLDGYPIYQLRLDAEPVYEGPATEVLLRDVARGERRLQVRVLAPNREELAQTDTIEVYVLRASILSPALNNNNQGTGGTN